MNVERFCEQITDRLGGNVGQILRKAVTRTPNLPDKVTEIRIRAGLPLCVRYNDRDQFLSFNGQFCVGQEAYRIPPSEISAVIQRICQHSRYAYTEDIKNGFVTIPGGHRIGIAGKMISDGSITEVSSMTVRIARQIPGVSKKVLPYIVRSPGDVYSTLIISPPGCGKTTMIRDVARALSNGETKPYFTGMNVGIVDERSEIAACYHMVPSNDLGFRTDVYDGCPKDKGILMMLRSMAPGVIITDELGGTRDLEAITSAMNAGVRIIATAHGYGLQKGQLRQEIQRIMEQEIFERYVVLSCKQGPGTLESVYTTDMEKIYERRELI